MDIHCSNQEAEVLQKVAAASELLQRNTYLVGGFVRDKLLGRATTDMDFVCLGDALELATKAAAQFKPVPPPKFSMNKNSDFYKELVEVYEISKEITKKGDTSEEIAIAQFWDCNPYVSVTRGHLMFATKKITPGAHWIGITKIASKKENRHALKWLPAIN